MRPVARAGHLDIDASPRLLAAPEVTHWLDLRSAASPMSAGSSATSSTALTPPWAPPTPPSRDPEAPHLDPPGVDGIFVRGTPELGSTFGDLVAHHRIALTACGLARVVRGAAGRLAVAAMLISSRSRCT